MHLQGCEREVAEAQNGSSDELVKECIMRLSWALVHSRHEEDVQRGIAMLQGGIIYPKLVSLNFSMLQGILCLKLELGPTYFLDF